MTLEQIQRDPDAMKALRSFFTDPKFKDIRIAFTNHSPKGDTTTETGASVSHGQNLGTRYVFNKIEEIVTTPKPKQFTSPKGPDPDLET